MSAVGLRPLHHDESPYGGHQQDPAEQQRPCPLDRPAGAETSLDHGR